MKIPLLFLLLLAIPHTLLHADIVYLRSGARVEGKIVAQNRTTVRIETAAGIRVFARDSVRRIVYSAYDLAAARRPADEQRKQQAASRKRQQAALRNQQKEALLRRQQEDLRRTQEQAVLEQLDRLRKTEAEKREAARRQLEQAEAERRQPEPESKLEPVNYGGGPGWLDFFVPGMGQFRAGRSVSGSALAGGALLALAGAGALENQRAGFSRAYDRTDGLLNFLLLSNNEFGGGNLDLILSLQRDAIGSRHDQSAAARQGALGLLAGVYLFNAFDLILLPPGNTQGLRIRFGPEGAALAYELRF